uniref:Putative secreted protein n=1 Tax=Anopheles darlingi TaxID=43151 RepID=A0A2M4DAH9_ANODA
MLSLKVRLDGTLVLLFRCPGYLQSQLLGNLFIDASNAFDRSAVNVNRLKLTGVCSVVQNSLQCGRFPRSRRSAYVQAAGSSGFDHIIDKLYQLIVFFLAFRQFSHYLLRFTFLVFRGRYFRSRGHRRFTFLTSNKRQLRDSASAGHLFGSLVIIANFRDC